jgi:acetyl-CoA acyltransferase
VELTAPAFGRRDVDVLESDLTIHASGHSLGASGGRILGTLTAVLGERRAWGVAAIWIGVGRGLAMVIENLAAA